MTKKQTNSWEESFDEQFNPGVIKVENPDGSGYYQDGVKNVKASEIKNFIKETITLQRAEERELIKREIIIYQNRFVIAHDQGPDAAPEIEFEPEYDVIEKLLNSLK